jgi:hypothetical protein
MVFKAGLRETYLTLACSNLKTPHDWLLGRIALAIGNVYFDAQPQIKYRLHSDNSIGKRSLGSLHNLRIGLILKHDPYYIHEYKSILSKVKPNSIAGSETFRILSNFTTRSRLLFLLPSVRLRFNPIINWAFKILLISGFIPYFLQSSKGKFDA